MYRWKNSISHSIPDIDPVDNRLHISLSWSKTEQTQQTKLTHAWQKNLHFASELQLTDWLTVAPLLVSVHLGGVHSDRWARTPLPQLCRDQSGAAVLALVVTVSALDSQESLWASRWKRFGGTSLFFVLFLCMYAKKRAAVSCMHAFMCVLMRRLDIFFKEVIKRRKWITGKQKSHE